MEKKLKYNDYINQIVNIFSLSKKEKSILFEMKIENYMAKMKLFIVSQMGTEEKFRDVFMKCDSSFCHSFLMPLVQKIYCMIPIKKKDIVFSSDESLVTFRLISENNDLFSVDGLSSDDAKSLMKSLDNISQKMKEFNFYSDE